MNAYPNACLTGWAIVYGHLLKDDTILAVFDSESKDRRTFVDLCRDNAGSKYLPTIMDKGVDLGDAGDLDEGESTGGDEDE